MEKSKAISLLQFNDSTGYALPVRNLENASRAVPGHPDLLAMPACHNDLLDVLWELQRRIAALERKYGTGDSDA